MFPRLENQINDHHWSSLWKNGMDQY